MSPADPLLSSLQAVESLEWKRMIELARGEARTERGRTLVGELADPSRWAPDLATARLLQQETQEASQLLDRDALWGPLTGLADPEPSLDRLSRGAVLEVAEMALIRAWLYAIDSWVQTPREELRGELFKKALQRLSEPHLPIQALERILTPEGELSERASPRLAALHSEIRGLRREITLVLDQLIKSLSARGVLQESFTDVRDGRFVLPVRISSQAEVEGIIHEASASRQTVFVEPREVADLNNRLRQRRNELIQETYAILAETSGRLLPFAGEIGLSVDVISRWDATQARARFGRRYGGKPIQVSEDRLFLLHQTAHPLLWWSLPSDSIIRNEIDFGDPARTLLLTGPNTGGKTVLLKTLGLAGICARSGFPFPGTDLPVVPFFDAFFADLGDPQSIERHLSSFAGHLLRFREILENVTGNSLVLIDELNSATDPEEGAALGRAFLETLMGRGAVTVTTTHDPHLKAASVSDARIVSASMQFDEGSRAPTYRMLTGTPGRSRALETAERLGLPPDVVELARSYLSREHLTFESLLSRLDADRRAAEKERRDATAIREEAERMKREWTERTQASVGELLDRTRQKLRKILEQAQDEAKASVRKLNELHGRGELGAVRSRLNETFEIAASRVESSLREEAPDIANALESRKKEEAAPPPELRLGPGSIVRVPKWKNTGMILELKDKKVRVALGTLQMTLSVSDIEPLLPSELAAVQATQARNKARGSESPSTGGLGSVAPPQPRLDLRGIRLDEAMSQLERYLDQAFRSGALAQVTIVHGLGTGALREGTRKVLAGLPYVRDYHDGGAGQGGAGATVVEFDRD